jgi:hypothetical protein
MNPQYTEVYIDSPSTTQREATVLYQNLLNVVNHLQHSPVDGHEASVVVHVTDWIEQDRDGAFNSIRRKILNRLLSMLRAYGPQPEED